MNGYRDVLSAGLVLGLLVVSGTASAAEPEIYDWQNQEAPIMVQTEGGLVFLGKDRQPRRAYEWDRAEGDKHRGLFFPDLDQDGSYEIVGAGDPTFALHNSSNPLWSLEDGCDQAIVADFAANDKLDIMCTNRDTIDIYTHDEQNIWSAELGVSLDWCRAGDFNGDLKADLECKLRGRDSYTRVDVNAGKLLAQESDEAKIEDDALDLDEATPVSSKVWEGEKEFDVNGDGAAEESITADGSAIVLQSRSKEKAIARVEFDDTVQSAFVKNLDGEGKPEIVVATESSIAVLDAEGETLGTYPVEADDYERQPVAALESLYADGFKDDEKAKQVVEEAQERLASCYSDRVSGNLFVGIGEVIYKTHVDADGEATDIEQMHSAIRDDEVESCAEGIFEDLDYPSPEESEDDEEAKATLNVTLKFTFADEPR